MTNVVVVSLGGVVAFGTGIVVEVAYIVCVGVVAGLVVFWAVAASDVAKPVDVSFCDVVIAGVVDCCCTVVVGAAHFKFPLFCQYPLVLQVT